MSTLTTLLAAERERCAKEADAWSGPSMPDFTKLPGDKVHKNYGYIWATACTAQAHYIAAAIRALPALPSGFVAVPREPTEEQWGGLARDVMLWMDIQSHRYTPISLLEHLKSAGREIPQWLLDEPEMKNLDHSMSKGTRCVIIYKAMLAASEVKP